MKKILSFVLVFSLSLLTACANTENVHYSTSGQPGIFKEYPGNTGIEIKHAETTLPKEILTTDASENGLKGTLYSISGTVKSSEELGEVAYFIIETADGNVAVLDMLSYDLSESSSIDIEELRPYFPLPSVGEQIQITAQYLGHSGSLDLAMFLYGGQDYFAEAYVMASLNSMSVVSPESSTQADPVETTAPPEKGSKDNPYRAGMYKVGTDLPAGEYLFFSNSSHLAYVCASSDSNQDDIIENENFSNSFFMTVTDGQYLQAKRCYFVKASDCTITINDDGTLEEGMYRVGIDIPAGEYQLTADEDKGYWCLYSDSTIPFDIDDNDNFDGSTYVTVRDGQYLQVKRCTAKPA